MLLHSPEVHREEGGVMMAVGCGVGGWGEVEQRRLSTALLQFHTGLVHRLHRLNAYLTELRYFPSFSVANHDAFWFLWRVARTSNVGYFPLECYFCPLWCHQEPPWKWVTSPIQIPCKLKTAFLSLSPSKFVTDSARGWRLCVFTGGYKQRANFACWVLPRRWISIITDYQYSRLKMFPHNLIGIK